MNEGASGGRSKAMGATVHCIVERPLAVLFEALEGADWVGQGVSSNSKVDYWINMMDLAGIHFAQTKEVPAPTKLNVPQASVTRASEIVAPFSDAFKVGVIWTGSVTYKGNAFRSFQHTDFMPLTDVEGVQLFSLYKGPMLEPYFADGTSGFIVDAGSDERGFADTAATMQAMDLIYHFGYRDGPYCRLAWCADVDRSSLGSVLGVDP